MLVYIYIDRVAWWLERNRKQQRQQAPLNRQTFQQPTTGKSNVRTLHISQKNIKKSRAHHPLAKHDMTTECTTWTASFSLKLKKYVNGKVNTRTSVDCCGCLSAIRGRLCMQMFDLEVYLYMTVMSM